MNLEKTIPVENDNLDLAIKIAHERFEEEYLTDEWLDARDVSFEKMR